VGGHFSGGGVVDVMVSRSTDGGLTWTAPVTVAATGVFYDKNWTTCDNTPASPFYGHCYAEFDNASAGDLELMSTSAHGGLSWGSPPPPPHPLPPPRRPPPPPPPPPRRPRPRPRRATRRAAHGPRRRPVRRLSRHPGLQLRYRWRPLERLRADLEQPVPHRPRGTDLAAALRRDQPPRHGLRRM